MTATRRSAVAQFVQGIRSRLSQERTGGRVARGSLQSILVNGTGAAASFLVQIMVARMLGIDGYGTYLLAMGWLAIAQLFAKLELDSTSVRFVGSYTATMRWSLLRGFLQSSRNAVLMTSIAIAALSAAGIFVFSDAISTKHPGLPGALLMACLLLPVVTRLVLEAAVLQGLQRYVEAQLPINLFRPLVFGLIVVVLTFIVGMTTTVPRTVGANLLSTILALAIATIWRRRAMPSELLAATPAHDRQLWARTAYPLFAVSLGQVILSQQTDVIVVGLMLTTSDAAIYGAASQLTMPLVLAASSVTYVAQPMIADMYARDPQRLQGLVRAVTWIATILAIPIAIALITVGPYLLRLYGPSYTAGHSVLVILTAAQFVVGVVGSLAGFLMTMTAHEREAAQVIISTAVLNIVLALVLTPKFGSVGTASATLFAAVARTLALRFYIKREMGLSLPAF